MTKITSAFLKVTIILLTCAFFLNVVWDDAQPSTRTPNVPSYPGFSSIDPSRNHFIVFGDTRGKSPWEFWLEKTGKIREEILQEIGEAKPAFVINLGDLVLRGGSTRSWLEFDRLHAAIREEGIAYFPILGNHEMQGNTETALRNYFIRFPHLNGRRWYSFTWKNIGFIMLDSNISALTPAERSEQIRWYTAELERFEAEAQVGYVIACTHEPPFTNRAKTPVGHESTKLFAEPFLRFGKTRLLFSGHVHSYERFLIGSKHFIVSGGGGAPRGKLVIDPARRKYEDGFPGGELRFFHFCLVEVQGESILLRILRLEPDGSFLEADRVNLSPKD